MPILSSGEHSIKTQLASGGIRIMPGQEVRLLSIPVSGTFGLFNHLHGFKGGGQLADAIVSAARENYGHAGPALVRHILSLETSELLSTQDFYINNCLKPKNNEEGRAARVFALTALAGELAIEAKIVPWDKGAAFESVRYVFDKWREERESNQYGSEHFQILRAVNDFIEKHAEGRFSALDNPDQPEIRDLVGYKESPIFYFTAGGLAEATKGFEISRVISALKTAGVFSEVGENGHASKARRVTDGRIIRLYHIDAAKLSEAFEA